MTDKKLKLSDLSADQKVVYDSVMDWAAAPTRLLTVGGYAGSGKTTVLSLLADTLPAAHIAFATFTGKASSVLKRKLQAAGVDLSPHYIGTIHGLIYKPIMRGGQVVGWSLRDELTFEGADPTPRASLVVPQNKWGYEANSGTTRKAREGNYAPGPTYDLVIVDEASMVHDDMLEDIAAYGVPILAVGDHGQLPPVSGSSSLVEAPDLRLETIHRQAADNPIIKLSMIVRETGRLDAKLADGKHILVKLRSTLPGIVEERYAAKTSRQLFEIGALCYKNSTRVMLNQMIRKARKVSGRPTNGEQIICLRNMKDTPIFNGMRGLIVGETSMIRHLLKVPKVDFLDEQISHEGLELCGPQFNRDRTFSSYEDLAEHKVHVKHWEDVGALFDYGYALTVHKSQGSSFDDVLVVCERPSKVTDEDWRRWGYTAITRSSNRVTLFL